MNTPWFLAWLPLAIVLPLLAAAVIGVRQIAGPAGGDAAEPGTARLATLAAASGLLPLLAALAGLATLAEAPGRIEYATWLEAGELRLALALQPNLQALLFALIAQSVGWVALRFSRTYLHREAAFHRFHAGLCLFLGGMQIIILGGDAALVFVGWELAGISSWLLIGYDRERPAATGNALAAFVTNRIGDAGFLLGLALCYLWLESSAWSALAEAAQGGGLDKVSARLLLFGLFIAAAAKSAQLPLSGWLPRALEGPTPSSALFYGAIMVHAGVWLLIRLEPVLRLVPDIMIQVALFGAATALYGWLVGLVQSDVKSSLLFATLTQVGLMFLACGLGFFDFAFLHLCLHALLRAGQFLLAPSYLHLLPGPTPPPPAWLALSRHPRLYGVALARGWLDTLAAVLVSGPAQAVSHDLRTLDARVLGPLVAPSEDEPDGPRRGAVGRGLAWAAAQCAHIEERLTRIAGSGRLATLLGRVGNAFLEVEALLERPRYLLLLIAATFMVIL